MLDVNICFLKFVYLFIDFFFLFEQIDQRLDLCKLSADDLEPVKGQIIVSLTSRDSLCGGTPIAVVGPGGDVRVPEEEENEDPPLQEILPDGWEERKTPNGR